MNESSNGEDAQKDSSRGNDFFAPAGSYQPGLMVSPHYFTQQMYYPYVNPYSHLTEASGNMSIHGYGSDGRPKFRRSRTIFSPEQLDILETHFEKYKYPDVKRRRTIAEEVGLPEERVQVWFQNRRAKNKRQTDQQVKLQKLVNDAISTNAGNQRQRSQKDQASSEEQAVASCSSTTTQEYEQNPFSRPNPHHTGDTDESMLHRIKSKSQRLESFEVDHNRNLHASCYADSKEMGFAEAPKEDVSQKMHENTMAVQNMWLQSNSSSFGSPEAPVVVQSIDQDLLFKVANILSASNDAASLIAEWSQTPNRAHTNNLEEQLRHFAEHHQQVLTHHKNGNTNIKTCNTTQEHN